jgi:hypothetical protein
LTLAAGGARHLLLNPRLASLQLLLDRIGVWTACGDRGASDAIALDHVDRADVAELGHDERGDRVKGLVERAPFVRRAGDLVEHAEAAVDLPHFCRGDGGDHRDDHQGARNDHVSGKGH